MKRTAIEDTRICVIGLGYVGLPLARLFSTKYPTIGFDMNRQRVEALMAGHDATLELFAVNVVLGLGLSLLIGAAGILPGGIRMIGYIVPALLVRDLQKQGFAKTGVSLGIVAGLCALCLLWFGVL